MKLVMDFDPIHGNAYTLVTVLATLVWGPITNTNKPFQTTNYVLNLWSLNVI